MDSHGVPWMYILYGPLGVPIALGVAQRWRRLASSPVLLPGEAAQLYATRSEAQIGADWMCIPAARNLHWRYQILCQAFGLQGKSSTRKIMRCEPAGNSQGCYEFI